MLISSLVLCEELSLSFACDQSRSSCFLDLIFQENVSFYFKKFQVDARRAVAKIAKLRTPIRMKSAQDKFRRKNQ
jgi:hypothetical protein